MDGCFDDISFHIINFKWNLMIVSCVLRILYLNYDYMFISMLRFEQNVFKPRAEQ